MRLEENKLAALAEQFVATQHVLPKAKNSRNHFQKLMWLQLGGVPAIVNSHLNNVPKLEDFGEVSTDVLVKKLLQDDKKKQDNDTKNRDDSWLDEL